MRNTVLIFITLATLPLFSQQKINVFKGFTSVLIFDSEIVNIIPGNDLDYIIEKDNNSFSQNKILTIKVLLESLNTSNTNLIVFTKDGSVFNFDLIYKKPVNLIHNISAKQVNTTLKFSEEIRPKPSKKDNLKILDNGVGSEIVPLSGDKMLNVISICKANQNRKKRIFQKLYKSYNVILSLKDIAYNKDDLYLFFNIKNKGNQAYDIEYMRFFLSTREDGITSTNQKKSLNVFYIHNEPKKIRGKSIHEFIVVIDKTSINENKAITIRIKEQGGERDLNLNIKDQIINNPVKI